MSRFKTIKQVWKALDNGETVYYSNTSYKVYVEPDLMPERTREHEGRQFAERNGSIMSVRCISNYFGSIIKPSYLPNLFTDKD